MRTGAGASAQEAANDFERLVNDSLALKKTIEANYDAFEKPYIEGYEKYLQSLERFGKSLTPQFTILSASVYPLKMISSSIWLRWYSTDNFNAIQKYRGIYVDYWTKASQVIKEPATAQKPEPPKPQQKPATDQFMDMAKIAGVAAIGLAAVYVWRSTAR